MKVKSNRWYMTRSGHYFQTAFISDNPSDDKPVKGFVVMKTTGEKRPDKRRIDGRIHAYKDSRGDLTHETGEPT